MPKREKKKGGGSKLNKTQTVTLRLDPRLRYLTDLAARTQRRTTSAFIEWSIEQSMREIVLKFGDNDQRTLADEASKLWDVDEADRLAKLAMNYPGLLTHDEQVIWKLIIENDAFWDSGYSTKWDSMMMEKKIKYRLIRELWDTLKAVAKGNENIGELQSQLSNISAIDDGFDDSNLTVEDRAKKWDADPKIRAEFGTYERYESFMKHASDIRIKPRMKTD